PGCTIEALPIPPPCELCQFQPLSSNQPASVPVSPAAADSRVSTLSNMPFFWIPETAVPRIHQRTSSSPAANIARPALRRDIAPARQSGYLSPLPCAAPRLRSHVRTRT